MHGSATTKAMDGSPGGAVRCSPLARNLSRLQAGGTSGTFRGHDAGRGSPPPVKCLAADARLKETYRRILQGERAALLLTDPPYCLLTRRRKGGDPRDKRRSVKIDRDPVVRFEDVRDYRRLPGDWLPAAAAHVDRPLGVRTE